ncbi:nurim homolog [Periplaneta americana]|uniref:nurim homolog n=1 Tax=Periplaneta americana TaxID=6978 RepID=UPI0037E7473A
MAQVTSIVKMVYNTIFKALLVLISACGMIFAFVTGGYLIQFLSSIASSSVDVSKPGGATSTLWAMTVNLSLLCIFMFQHSVMAKPLFKRALYSSGFQVVERSIYVIATSLALQCVMLYWHPIPWINLWNVDTSGTVLWSVFTAAHCFAWCIIYSGSLMMDIAELLGIKQVFYYLRGLPDPVTYKSRELQRFYLHMRHPSFTGFLILFWVYPLMSLDRALLAGLWTLYMIVAWNVDQFDYQYQSHQLRKKQYEMVHSKVMY